MLWQYISVVVVLQKIHGDTSPNTLPLILLLLTSLLRVVIFVVYLSHQHKLILLIRSFLLASVDLKKNKDLEKSIAKSAVIF